MCKKLYLIFFMKQISELKGENEMSKADEVFVAMCNDILTNGTDNKGEDVRPVWTDTNEPAYTLARFGVVNRYDLSKEFPAITLRRTAIKTCTEEMLWIWQRKSNNIHDLRSTVWDEWADKEGFIGKAYGYQQAKMYGYPEITIEGIVKAFPDVTMLPYFNGNSSAKTLAVVGCTNEHGQFTGRVIGERNGDIWYMTQIDKAIYDLVNTPFSRRIIVSMWNPEEQKDMHLAPCAYEVTFMVTEKNGEKYLNAVLNQRSNDLLAAGNWNVCQYAVLVHMVARHVGMKAGELVHVIANAHIYDRHIPIVKELIKREQHPAPDFWLNPEKTSFYSFTEDDVRLDNYQTGEQVRNIPIAV